MSLIGEVSARVMFSSLLPDALIWAIRGHLSVTSVAICVFRISSDTRKGISPQFNEVSGA